MEPNRAPAHACKSTFSKSRFSSLPIELKEEVLVFVRSKVNQGNARLVSKEWNRPMRPQMFRKLTTSLNSHFVEGLLGSENEQYSCVCSIRTLVVGGRQAGPDYNSQLLSFLRRLSENELLEFHSPKDTPLSLVQLQTLLQHQSNIQRFHARLRFSDGDTPASTAIAMEQMTLFRSTLCSMRLLLIYVEASNTRDGHHPSLYDLGIKCNAALVNTAPLLESLEIFGWSKTSTSWGDRTSSASLLKSALNPETLPKTLKHLLIADMDLRGADRTLTKAVNVVVLHSLKIEYRANVESLLHALADVFRGDQASTS